MKNLSKLALLASVAAALAVGACDRLTSPAPHALSEAPVRSAAAALHRVPGHVPAHVNARASTALIGRDGGSLELAGHRLVVPAGAVSHPTRFSIHLEENGFVQVDLQAGSANARGQGNDVGEKGFATPVQLHLSYATAEGGYDPDQLVVVWVTPSGDLQPFATTHDAGTQTVSAQLDHFSPYALASN